MRPILDVLIILIVLGIPTMAFAFLVMWLLL